MIAIAAVISLLLTSCLALPAMAEEANDYTVSFSGAEYLIPSEEGVVVVNIATDRPSGDYSWNASISSGTITPKTGTGSADSLNITVTAPTTIGDAVLSVTLTNGTVNHTSTYTLHVIEATVISASVKNSGYLAMKDVKVRFLADGAVLNETTFDIAANATSTLSYNWTVHGLSAGEHTVQVMLDPDNEYVRFLDGSSTYTSKFFVGESIWGTMNIILAILVALLIFIVFLTYMNRGKKGKKKT